ncbi:fumarylacetoacetate hydrolase [Dipodascopsis uninucleata]
MVASKSPYFNFMLYETADGASHVGHLDLESSLVTPLAFSSGSPVSSIYEIIDNEATFSLEPVYGEKQVRLSEVILNAPFPSRDVLAVGKNYYDHAKEFNSSGFDSSDRVDTPSHPVIFTKKASSIVPYGADIYPHPEFTSTLDFEGEVGVIIKKRAYKVDESDAMDYVWGYTIINDVTARERQRDHKQFFIGKSGDTFCPMGPIAVPKEYLPEYLKLQTFVNGKKRQSDSTKNLIFSIPTLLNVISSGITLLPGDIIATGTPAGVGIGMNPPIYLEPRDFVEISVTGLGTLMNQVGQPDNPPTTARSRTIVRKPGQTKLGQKVFYFEDIGEKGSDLTIVCIHGLGFSSSYYKQFVKSCGFLEHYRVVLIDLEGFGNSITEVASIVSIESYADDVYTILKHIGVTKNAVLIGHSMGCPISSIFTIKHPEVVEKLILMAPLYFPMLDALAEKPKELIAEIRLNGINQMSEAMAQSSLSKHTLEMNPLAVMYVEATLKANDTEGYIKGANALATQGPIEFSTIAQETLIIQGECDQWPSIEEVTKIKDELQNASIETIPDVSHFHILEAFDKTVSIIKAFFEKS